MFPDRNVDRKFSHGTSADGDEKSKQRKDADFVKSATYLAIKLIIADIWLKSI